MSYTRTIYDNTSLRTEYIFFCGVWLLLIISTTFNLSNLFAPFLILRFGLGLTVIGFIPGYFLQIILFPRKENLSKLERLVVSVGLSLALIPIFALILDYLSLGFSTLVLSSTLGITSLVFGFCAWFRRIYVSEDHRYVLFGGDFDLRVWRLQISPKSGLFLIALGLIGTMMAIGVGNSFLPKPNAMLTEFYLLDAQGRSSAYPTQIVIGDETTVQFGIVNQEGKAEKYWVEVWANNSRVGISQLIDLQNGESVQQAIPFKLDHVGDQQIQFYLYENSNLTVYRTLHLWIDVLATN